MADKKHILIVEDDFDLAEMLNAYFRAQGYQVTTANWGEDAVRMALETPPDIAILDIRLPDINGYEVCRRLRQDRHTQYLPVIFLTEKRERDDKLAGLELGAVDYITKPFDIQELRLRVRNALRRADLNTITNPVTGIPEGSVVQERLEKMLRTDDWAVIIARIRGLNKFRDKYGFVAADDVARAISLMLSNAMQENQVSDHFVGHLDSVDFIIMTTTDKYRKLAQSCRQRLESSLQYFYPAMDRARLKELPVAERLRTELTMLAVDDGEFNNLAALRQALNTPQP